MLRRTLVWPDEKGDTEGGNSFLEQSGIEAKYRSLTEPGLTNDREAYLLTAALL